MKKCLIVANLDINADPRPHRMYEWLKKDFIVESISFNEMRYNSFLSKITRKSRHIFSLILKKYEWIFNFNCLQNFQKKSYDLIVCHDLFLLPWVIKNKKTAKVVFDAREYYPRHQEDSFLWKLLFQKQNIYLCDTYLKKCDLIITVSDGIAKEYRKVFDVKCSIIPSLSDFQELLPKSPNKDKIRIIHHGSSSKNRLLENMIYIMDNLDEKFELDLMLVNTDKKYFNFLKDLTLSRKNVKLISPVPLNEITSYINQYDIGIFDAKPTTFNLKYCLPNKFFEFIQGRLMIAVGPSLEMAKYIKQYDLGIVAESYEPKVMAHLIKSLTLEDIYKFKNNAHKTAKILCSEENKKKFISLISPILR